MNAYDVILTRQCIREYTEETISEDLIEDLLKAAMQAPSAHNRQPWEFLIITDKKKLESISQFHPYAQMAKKAHAALLVCGNAQEETNEAFLIQDCAAATENILLAAHAKNLGSVWCGIYDDKKRIASFRKLFNIPLHIIPLALVVLGFPNEKRAWQNRYNERKIHKNSWQ